MHNGLISAFVCVSKGSALHASNRTSLLSCNMVIVPPSLKISQRNWAIYLHASVLAQQLVLSCNHHA
uniref:Uncharacterized protein n=1 Tax=Arundo donax TaxID=35708 RepID=A0A0A9DTM2_ARUDO